jgi:hypothetical protein
MMKRNLVLEAQILKAVEVLGDATEQEIANEIKEQFEVEVNSLKLTRNLGRWVHRKSLTLFKKDGETIYKMRDAPPFFKSLQIFQMKGLTGLGAEEIIKKLEAHYQAMKATVSREPLIGDFKLLQCTFQTLDPIAGGDSGKEDRFLEFPRKEGKLYIRRNWLRGLFRDNARVQNVNASYMADHVGFSDSEPLDAEIKIIDNVKVQEGMSSYETIPPKTQFTCMIRFPFRGSPIKTIDNFKEFCKVFEVAPIKGLGAYSNYFGGRIKLVEIKEA